MIWYAGYFCQDRRVLQSISVTSLPTKTNYNYGDALSTSGMVVTASYSNGRTKVVSGWKCSPTTLNGYGNQTITVTYVDGKVTATTTFTVEVAYLGYLTVPTVSGSYTYSGAAQSGLYFRLQFVYHDAEWYNKCNKCRNILREIYTENGICME